MSVTFSASTVYADYDNWTGFLNMSNVNAFDLLRWLDLPVDYCGEISVAELTPKLRRRLWEEDRNLDPAIESNEYGGPGTGHCKVIECGRDPGYLRNKTKELLALCEKAGNSATITWG
jgi:hypothetical protein